MCVLVFNRLEHQYLTDKLLRVKYARTMIRGYVVVVDRDSPVPDVRTFTDFNLVAVKLIEDNSEFFVNVEGTNYSFKVK